MLAVIFISLGLLDNRQFPGHRRFTFASMGTEPMVLSACAGVGGRLLVRTPPPQEHASTPEGGEDRSSSTFGAPTPTAPWPPCWRSPCRTPSGSSPPNTRRCTRRWATSPICYPARSLHLKAPPSGSDALSPSSIAPGSQSALLQKTRMFQDPGIRRIVLRAMNFRGPTDERNTGGDPRNWGRQERFPLSSVAQFCERL